MTSGRLPERAMYYRDQQGDVWVKYMATPSMDLDIPLDRWLRENCAPGTDAEIVQTGAGEIIGVVLVPPTSYSVPDQRTSGRRFRLVRHEDVSTISGTGVVAHGVQWPDGAVALRWAIPDLPPSTAVWDSIEAVEAIHGHQGKTEVEWID